VEARPLECYVSGFVRIILMFVHSGGGERRLTNVTLLDVLFVCLYVCLSVCLLVMRLPPVPFRRPTKGTPHREVLDPARRGYRQGPIKLAPKGPLYKGSLYKG
jgi:hypothetical protein